MPGVPAVTRAMIALVTAAVALLTAACSTPQQARGPIATPPAPPSSSPATSPPAPPSPTPPAVTRRSAALEDQPVSARPAPTRLEIADLGIDVRVAPVGLDAEGRMALFDDPSVAAWYQWGAAPASELGSTVIAAHVDSLTYDLLPFARLRDAKAGMPVAVTDASGARRTYLVQAVEVTEKADVDWAAAFDRGGPPRLTLVTCGGEFDAAQRRYLSNLVLTATPAG